MSAAFFIAGTDTEIGKTTVAAGLLHAARSRGLSTAAAKPVASDCVSTAEGLRNGDALALLGECSLPLAYAEVNPFAFAPAIAPRMSLPRLASTTVPSPILLSRSRFRTARSSPASLPPASPPRC